MNEQQSRFVKAYIENGGVGAQAAIEAGYSPNGARQTASRTLRMVDVAQAVEAAGATGASRVNANLASAAGSAEWVVKKLVDIIEGDTAARDRVAALALLARRLAEWRDGPSVMINSVSLPPGTSLDQIRELAAGIRAQLPAPPGDAGEQFLAPSGDD